MNNTWKRRSLSLLLALVMLLSVTVLSLGDNSEAVYYTVGESDYLLQMGTVVVNTDFGSQRGNTQYFYSDGYFAEDATRYNTHLAAMSMVLEGTANYNGYSSQAANFLGKLGFGRFAPNDAFKNGTNSIDSIGYLLASKTMTYADGTPTGKTIVAVVTRGAYYGKEWANNFLLGASGESAGFYNAGEQVMQGLNTYLAGMDTSSVIFWLVGHSRGGAVSNQVGRRLIAEKGISQSSVYAYTSGTPKSGVAGGSYPSLHCITNANDLVTWVAPSGYGFARYTAEGSDHQIEGLVGTEEYIRQFEKLTKADFEEVYPTSFHAAYLGKDLSSIKGISSALTSLVENKDDMGKLYDDFVRVGDSMPVSSYDRDLTTHLVDAWNPNRSSDYANRVYDLSGFNSGSIKLEAALGNFIAFARGTSRAQDQMMETFADGIGDIVADNILSLPTHLYRILNWEDESSYFKNRTLTGLWNMLDEANVDGVTLKGILGSDYDTIKQSYPSVADFLFYFICRDYNKEYSKGISVESDRLYLTVTLLNNVKEEDCSIITAHYLGSYIAAAMTEDDFYTAPYHVTVDGHLCYIDGAQPTAEGAASICLAGYDESGKLVTTERVELAQVAEGGFVRLHSGTAVTWQVFFLGDGFVPVTNRPYTGVNAA